MTKLLKAEMWDKMQFLFRNYYDRMVHAVLYYDKGIDTAAMKNVLIAMTEKAPVLHSSFQENAVKPFWKVEKYTVDDILTVTDSNELEKDVDEFITQSIPVESNVQFKVAIINGGDRTALCVLINHMCCDGGDFKYFLRKLSENYNSFVSGRKTVELKSGSRSYEAVYSKLEGEDLQAAKKLYKNISAVKDTHYFPLTPEREGDKTIIVKRKILSDKFAELRAVGKKLEVTVNDLVLASYIRSLYEIGNFPDSDSLTIPCMVDLRRHIEGGGENTGLTNHTGFMQCSVPNKGETINDTLINVLRSVKKNKKDKFLGLYSLPLLKLAYTVFPHALSETAIKIGYLNPLIGMSNIGVLDTEKLKFGDAEVVDGFLTGAVKYKPYMQLSLATIKDVLTLTVAIRGNSDDEKVINEFFDLMEKNFNALLSL